VKRLRNRLILIFLAATLAPLAATVWITTRLLDRSLSYASTRELNLVSKSLEKTGIELYRQARERLRQDVRAGRVTPRPGLPREISEFAESGEAERFVLSGKDGERLDYLVRRGGEVLVYSAELGVPLKRIAEEYREARALVGLDSSRDLRRGFTYTFVLLAACVWILSLVLLVIMANRTERLQRNTERLVYFSQIASWQALARKMAHELKNSLTPIRLTVEEMLARYEGADRRFVEQAAQIVVEEVESLERRVRAFSDFSSEPPVRPAPVDVNSLLEERIAFLKGAHPEVTYSVRAQPGLPTAWADEDLLKGILTNLLENAAEAAGNGGQILGVTSVVDGAIAVDVHDSGPGLNEDARKDLFQPTISFKKRGMGLGLSIARRSALRLGGDVHLLNGELAGAGFRVLVPAGDAARSHS